MRIVFLIILMFQQSMIFGMDLERDIVNKFSLRNKLHKAIYRNDLLAIQQVIVEGVDVNSLWCGIDTFLGLSARMGEIKTSKALLLAGADPFKIDMCGNRPLHYAISFKKKTMIVLFLNAMYRQDPQLTHDVMHDLNWLEGNILLPDYLRYKLIKRAVKYRFYDAVTFFLEHVIHHADFIAELGLLDIAARNNDEKMFNQLAKYGVDLRNENQVYSILKQAALSDEGKELFKRLFGEWNQTLCTSNYILPRLLDVVIRCSCSVRYYDEGRNAVLEAIAGKLIIRNLSIITFLLCLKHSSHHAMRELYRQKLFESHFRSSYNSYQEILKNCEKDKGRLPKESLPVLDLTNINGIYLKFLTQSSSKFLQQERQLLFQKHREKLLGLHALQKEGKDLLKAQECIRRVKELKTQELSNQFDQSRISDF